MFSQTTRLEFIIVAVALLVLLLCSQPPKYGNAEILTAPPEPVAGGASDASSAEADFEPATAEPFTESLTDEHAPASDINRPETDLSGRTSSLSETLSPSADPADTQDRAARNSEAAAAGEVGVRYVWDGTRLVPQKVRIVDEGNGVHTVWSYDK